MGLLKDIPKHSSFEFEFLLPWNYRRQISPWVLENESNWGNYSFQVYVELDDPLKKNEVDDNIKDLLKNHGEDEIESEMFLYPLERWRLYSNFENGIEKGGMSNFVQLFSLIAIFIIVIACINFMNLSTARSERRAKEVGIRKTVGSSRGSLVLQFIAESILISFLAYIIAVLMAEALLPLYNNLVEKSLFIDYRSLEFWIFSITMILITGLISGSYPAFYLSSFEPIIVLKGKSQVGKNANMPRKILVTLQFSFSIFLIIGTLVIYDQIQLVKNRQLGYEQSNLIFVDLNEELDRNYQVIKNELLQSGVVEATTVSNSPITNINSNNFLGWPGKPEDMRVLFTTITCQYDYTKTMGIKVMEGRDFSEDFVSDSTAIIVNRAAMKIMQLENPIGTELDLWDKKRTLIGIVDDVMMGSPYQEVKPMLMIMDDWDGIMTIRMAKTDDLQASLKTIEGIFNKYNSAYPFDYKFADVEFQKKFSTINMTSRLSGIFAILTIFITGLGLLGLAAYTTEQRTKEIGVRKVMGATVLNIVTLISKDFSRLVILAFLISSPIAWYLLNWYLDRYPIRVDIGIWVFLVTGIFALAFALSIVLTQALRAAYANPVNSLRNE
ncbi:MAG: FtsX-like permease family protein [Cyclobacteriaceae bacterium]|nr:FtsX-like permease family protein [Cyclobacteriaceae bacterium]